MATKYNAGDTVICYASTDYTKIYNATNIAHKIEEKFFIIGSRDDLTVGIGEHVGVPLNKLWGHYDWNVRTGDITVMKQSPWKVVPDIDKYLGAGVIWIKDSLILSKASSIQDPLKSNLSDGTHCTQCNEWVPYQSSGYTCFQCRQDKYRFKF